MKPLIALSTLFAVATASAQTAHRAVLIDGFQSGERSDVRARGQMASIGAMLKGQGYAVASFAAPLQSFDAMRGALNGADVVVYWGHGIIRNSRTGTYNPQSADVGGIYVDGHDLSPDGLRHDVRLAKNAIVLLANCCYAAGTASGDEGQVKREVLEARMRNYAQPFLEIGARGVAACLDPKTFLTGVLAGRPVGKVYETSAYAGHTVSPRLDGYEFHYRESNAAEGLVTTSALIWKV